MKKLFLSVLVLMTAFSLTANGGQEVAVDPALDSNFNETGLPIVNEEVTMTAAVKVYAQESIKRSDLWLFKEMKNKTNVNIEFDEYAESSWAEKKNLIIASGDLPDMFFGSWIIEDRECLAFGLQGVLQPIEDLIPKYNPKLQEILTQKPQYRSTITTPEGHIYGYPNITEPNAGRIGACFFMNDEWLDKVGMDAPTNTDELYDVLKAFKAADLNGNGMEDEIPLSFVKFNGNNGLVPLFGMFGLNIYHNTAIYVKDGDVHFGAMEDNYKEAVIYFNKLFTEGLIDLEVFTQSPQVFQAKSRETSRLGSYIAWSSTWMTGTNDNPYSAIEPPAAPGTSAVWPIRNLGGPRPLIGMGITTSCEQPEILARWIDLFYDQELAVQALNGPFDKIILKDEQGNYYYNPEVENFGVEKLNYVPNSSFAPVLKETHDLFLPDPTRESKQELDEVYMPYISYDFFPTLYMTEDETEVVDELREDFKIFYQEKCANWIVNGGIEQEWDSYVKQLKAMGIDEMLAAYQSAYDRFTGK